MLKSRMAIAREMKGLKQTDLAKKVGVSQKAISKFEREGAGLSKAVLEKIAYELEFPLAFLLMDSIDEPELGALSFRAKTKKSAAQKAKARAASAFGKQLAHWMEDTYDLPCQDVPDYSNLDPESAARALRNDWSLGEGPIPDMIALLEAHGIRVFSISEVSEEIDAFSMWDDERNQPYVFLSTSKSGERRRMDAAHELGHLVMHRQVGDDEMDTREREKQANGFGSAFLMPPRGFRSTLRYGCTFSDIMKVKATWKVSAVAAIYRAHALGLMSDWQYHNMFVTASKQGLRTNEPNGISAEKSKVADMIFTDSERTNELRRISEATGLPAWVVLSMTFQLSAPIKILSGGGDSTDNKPTKPSLALV